MFEAEAPAESCHAVCAGNLILFMQGSIRSGGTVRSSSKKEKVDAKCGLFNCLIPNVSRAISISMFPYNIALVWQS